MLTRIIHGKVVVRMIWKENILRSWAGNIINKSAQNRIKNSHKGWIELREAIVEINKNRVSIEPLLQLLFKKYHQWDVLSKWNYDKNEFKNSVITDIFNVSQNYWINKLLKYYKAQGR